MAEPFDPEALLAALAHGGVRYVLIGGLAAALHGSPAVTGDADICPARDADNLERLVETLRSIDARIRTDADPDGVRFACDAEFFAGVDLVNLTTRHGDLDVAFSPAGVGGYDELAPAAITFDIDGLEVPVAALSDVIRSKEVADRPRDRAALPLLRALEDEIAARERRASPE